MKVTDMKLVLNRYSFYYEITEPNNQHYLHTLKSIKTYFESPVFAQLTLKFIWWFLVLLTDAHNISVLRTFTITSIRMDKEMSSVDSSL